MKYASPATARPTESALRHIARFFFGAVALTATASAAIFVLLPPGIPIGRRDLLVATLLVFAVTVLALMHFSRRPGFQINAASTLVGAAAVLLSGLTALLLPEGVRAPLLAFCALVVCAVGSISGARCAIGLGLSAAAMMAGLAGAESAGLIATGAQTSPLLLSLAFQWLVVFAGVILGVLISRMLTRYLQAAAEREARFRGLLRIATDWYWEQDRDLRCTLFAEASGASIGEGSIDLGEADPWDVDGAGMGNDRLAAHRAAVAAHRPFSNLPARRRDRAGAWRTISVSGEPRFDSGGRFRGYWGVARDVTDETRVQQAVAASETRYRELFERSPTALLLHRHGRLIEANAAAAQVFGYSHAAAMQGVPMVGLSRLEAKHRQVVERLAVLETLKVGEGLGVWDIKFRTHAGEHRHVQSTEVRVEAAGGPANLSLLFDITARSAAEAALRRSEALLSHVFANSPDGVTLTELPSERYVLVNEAFSRISGYTSNEIIGRTAIELGIWKDIGVRERMLARLARDGRVDGMPVVINTRSGARRSTLASAARFKMDDCDYLVVNTLDVTDLERARLLHTAILERASIGIAVTRDNRFLQANPFFERMFGWASGALTGQNTAVAWTSGDDGEPCAELISPPVASGQSFETESRLRRRDGSLFWCRLLARLIDRDDPENSGTIWIAEDVTERRRLDEALAAARDAAEAAHLAKSSFLANTSHEIRTPLNALLGLTRLAMQADLPEVRRQLYLAQIADSAEGLAGVMSDILDVSKVEAGKLTLDELAFDLRELLRVLHHAYESLAQVKGIGLQLTIDRQVPDMVWGDPVRVRQIVVNFVTNALKFISRGEVRIDCRPADPGRLRIAVSDTGPGVPEALQPRLFQRFSQGDSSTTRRFGGTGLGLSICRDLAGLMGGTVGMDSVPNDGSIFWAELPLPASAVPPTVASADTEAAEVSSLQGMRVLLAEDNAVNMMITVAMLELWGAVVTQVSDGRAAVDAVESAARDGRPFDVVLMDVQMPVMGGHEAARALRRHHPSRSLPIIALTAAALGSERDDAIDAGMDAFLTKPIDAARLRQTLAGLVRQEAAPAHRHSEPAA